MRFRPCIDIHNGSVKQIIGGSIDGDKAVDNFVSDKGADHYALLYKEKGLYGGHIALLNKLGTMEYEKDLEEAEKAFSVFPGGLMIGGGVNADNALKFIEKGASKVIVTSYIFYEGKLSIERLNKLKSLVGRERLVLDLSCRRKDGDYYVVFEKWQRFTEEKAEKELFDRLSDHCSEFLVHGVDVEGKKSGLDEELVERLSLLPYNITYAGGIKDFEDLEKLREAGRGRLDFTIGSALDIFGGNMPLEEVMKWLQ